MVYHDDGSGHPHAIAKVDCVTQIGELHPRIMGGKLVDLRMVEMEQFCRLDRFAFFG